MKQKSNSRPWATVKSLSWRIGIIAVAALGGVYLFTQLQGGQQPQDDAVAVALSNLSDGAPDPKAGMILEDIWKPAPTPEGGVSWDVLESTTEKTREDEDGFIMSTPVFSDEVEALDGERIKVAGWMMPLGAGTSQNRFILLGYPPGCPFHFHAGPMQFIEVIATTPFETDEANAHIVSGVLELTGEDESGIFYRMTASRPG